MSFNFRFSGGYVTDGAGQEQVNLDAYPTNTGGDDFGFATVNGVTFDRDNTVSDPRLAGSHRVINDGPQSLFVVNTGNGTFDVELACGDASWAGNQYVEIVDVDASNVVQSVLATVAAGIATTSDQWVDATGVVRTSDADWVSNQASTQVVVASGRLGVRVGSSTDETSDSQIAHLSITSVASSVPTIIEPTDNDVVYKGPNFNVEVTNVPDDASEYGFRIVTAEADFIDRTGDVFTFAHNAATLAIASNDPQGVDKTQGTFWFRPVDYVGS